MDNFNYIEYLKNNPLLKKNLLNEITLKKAQEYIYNNLYDKETLSYAPDFYLKQSEEMAADFLKFQDNLHEKDIYKYKDWDDLDDVIRHAKNTKSQKKIKAGKVDPKDLNDPNLIYNKDNIRIYKAPTRKDAIKYGCHTNMCISSRGSGEENFWKPNTAQGEKFFFIFNDKLEENNPKFTLTLRILKLENEYEYSIFSQFNNLTPLYQGTNYNKLSSILPQLKSLESLFNKNM